MCVTYNGASDSLQLLPDCPEESILSMPVPHHQRGRRQVVEITVPLLHWMFASITLAEETERLHESVKLSFQAKLLE